MSIVRLSLVKNRLFAPTPLGALEDVDYDPDARVEHGFLESSTYVEGTGRSRAAAIRKETALDAYLESAVSRVAPKLPPDAPVTVMVNGFLFDPRVAVTRDPKDTDNPHGRIFHFSPGDAAEEIRHHTTGWPLRLGFREADDGEHGLAVAFGWYSQPGHATSLISHGQNFYARAYDLGRAASWPLLRILRALSDNLSPEGRPIDIFCHSLGSVVVIRAIAIAAKHKAPVLDSLGRVILLGGSEYTGEAQIMYNRIAEQARRRQWSGDQGPQFYNIVSRENDILDRFAENFGPKSFFSDTQVIGHNGLEARRGVDRWIDMQIDGGRLQTWLGQFGVEVSGDNPGEIWDHWYYYTHRGNMDFYRRILRERDAWSIARLREHDPECPEGVVRGWFGD